MRFTIIGIVVLAMIAISVASPAKSKSGNTKCAKDCIVDYKEEDRVCAIENGKPLLFANQCVFNKFLCEHGDRKYVTSDISKCPPGTSERLN